MGVLMKKPIQFPSRNHNHRSCVKRLLADAEKECRRQKLRFTLHRREVLQIIASSHRPLGAYDILEQMNFSGKRQAPVVAYRALDFLINLGLVHRLNSLNAFVACMAAREDHTAQFLICRNCKNVGELNSIRVSEQIVNDAVQVGFRVDQQVVEIIGICSECGEL